VGHYQIVHAVVNKKLLRALNENIWTCGGIAPLILNLGTSWLWLP
jgi:hypothetical protein